MGIIAGSLPKIIDRNGNPAMMTMNGIPIDITDVKIFSALNKLSNYPPDSDVITEALHEIRKAVELFIEDDGGFKMSEPLGVLHQLQSFHIKTQNKLYINNSRIKETQHESVTNMVRYHAESISMKDSVKLNLAMLEQAECILTGSKDKEIISLIIDNLWELINMSSLQPTHKQDMTSVIMNMRRDRELGKHLELENVLDQIVSVFCTDDEQHEELAAMLASEEQ